MNTNTRQSKDLAPKSTVLGGGWTNHNETLIRVRDLTPKGEVKGGVLNPLNPNNPING